MAAAARSGGHGGRGYFSTMLTKVVAVAALLSIVVLVVNVYETIPLTNSVSQQGGDSVIEKIEHEHEMLFAEHKLLMQKLDGESQIGKRTPDAVGSPSRRYGATEAAAAGAAAEPGSRFGSRKKLLFNHLPKAGGKYAIKVLRKHVADEIKYTREFLHSTKEDRETHFVIANIREPYSWYVSLWHFGIQNECGGVRKVRCYGNETHGNVMTNEMRKHIFPLHPEISHILDDGPNNLENFHTFFDIVKVGGPLCICRVDTGPFSTRIDA